MAKMEDAKLLSQLQALEDDSASFTWGALGAEREKAMREYHRHPYGNEEEGWSSIVTSEVQDTVEWVLPALLKIFTSTDKAVSFDPARAEDVKPTEQATDSCNYVFYKQNDGFLILYTLFKDALTVKNCAVHWRKETKRVKTVIPVRGADDETMAMILQDAGEDAEVESATQREPQPMVDQQGQPVVDPYTGQPMMGPALIDARISKYEEKTSVKIEPFQPEDLLIKRDWTSPLLEDCPYVCRNMRVTLSDLHEMGFTDVEPSELDDSQDAGRGARFRENEQEYNPNRITDDDALTEGFLRIEYVLMDVDGDGIAERRCIYRLRGRILKNEESDHVPIATASPILNPHRWDGMSLAECMSDLQSLGTELTRQMLNGAYLSNNPRTEVLTDANWAPMANIDDLLDSRPGAILRKRQSDAITQNVTPWVGGQMFPMLEHVQRMGERRTGVSPSQQMDPNAIKHDRTAVEVQQTANAAAARIELVARIFAEILIKPIFKGILKLLTDGEMEKIAFRLRNEFVEFDPNEWRDSYDMTINVGLGTGDKEQQGAMLQMIFQNQMGLSQTPFGPLLITPKSIYTTQAKLVENVGFKNVGEFFNDPGEQQIQPPPDPALQIAQMKMQADGQKFQAESQRDMQLEQLKAQAKLQETQAQLELQAANDARDSERETLKASYDMQLAQQRLEFDKYKAELDNQTKLLIAQFSAQTAQAPESVDTGVDAAAAMTQAVAMLAEQMGRPKQVLRDAQGRVIGVQ